MDDLPGVNGDARLYSLDEPFEGVSYLAVAVVNWPRWHLVETQIFPATERGNVIGGPDNTLSIVLKVPPVDGVPLDHDASLATIGYTTDYTPWPPPEPTYKMIRALQALVLTDPGGNVLNLAEGEEIELPIPVADNLIAQGVVVAVEEGE
jgi:hypothetical protein